MFNHHFIEACRSLNPITARRWCTTHNQVRALPDEAAYPTSQPQLSLHRHFLRLFHDINNSYYISVAVVRINISSNPNPFHPIPCLYIIPGMRPRVINIIPESKDDLPVSKRYPMIAAEDKDLDGNLKILDEGTRARNRVRRYQFFTTSLKSIHSRVFVMYLVLFVSNC